MNKKEMCFLPAWKMADAIRRQEFTAGELTEVIIERIEKLNPQINAICTPTLELARNSAQKVDKDISQGINSGILGGIPTTIKDLNKTAGIRTTFGSKLYEHFIPEEDDVVVGRLRSAGIVLLGKSHTPEFGHVSVGENLIFGRVGNPWNLELNPGGSSSGAAAACAAGFSPLAHGSDGGGSVRTPASLCGIFGIKPSYGRVPNHPIEGMKFRRFSQQGPLTRYVLDAALLLDVMKGPHDGDRDSLPDDGISYFSELQKALPSKLKVGYWPTMGFVKAIDQDVVKAVDQGVQNFTKLGWDVIEVPNRLKSPDSDFMKYIPCTFAFDLGTELKKSREIMSPSFVTFIEAGIGMSARDLMKAQYRCETLYNEFFQLFKEYDIIVTPTLATPAFKADLKNTFPATIAGKAVSPIGWMPFTFPINMAGLPAASVPCGFSSAGLPIGMQIIGPRHNDLRVLQAAKAFEEVAPWQERIPPIAQL